VRWISGTANNDGVGLSPYNASRENSDGNLSGTRQTATVVSGDSVTIRGRTGDVNVIGSGVSGTHDVRVTADQGAVNVLADWRRIGATRNRAAAGSGISAATVRHGLQRWRVEQP